MWKTQHEQMALIQKVTAHIHHCERKYDELLLHGMKFWKDSQVHLFCKQPFCSGLYMYWDAIDLEWILVGVRQNYGTLYFYSPDSVL